MPDADMRLPLLRPDLLWFPGPGESDGAPTFTVHDPVRATYHKIGWMEREILMRLRTAKSLQALMAELRGQTTLRLAEQDVLALCQSAVNLDLTRATRVRPIAALLRSGKRTFLQTCLVWFTRMLFFRLPLLRPDAFLARTLPYVRILASRGALLLYALVLGAGFFLLAQQADSYYRTFLYFFTWQGAVFYALTLTGIKLTHEFTHAYTAKRLGVRVPTMGLAFMLFWPVPYCDVTDAWRLADRRQRLLISGAGILAETVLAGLALFVWAISPPGILRSLGFLVSSSGFLSTLLVNLNPGMRFDGYYILSDLLGVDNLQRRAFTLTRWALYRALLGAELPPPAPIRSWGQLARLMIYALYAWAYRLTLYVGIAVLLYYKFAKAVGMLLFCLEIVLFVVLPVVREGKAILTMRNQLRFNWRLLASASLFIALCLWLMLPLHRRLALPAILMPAQLHLVTAPSTGQITDLHLQEGQEVQAGQPLLCVWSPALDADIETCEIEKDRLQKEMQILAQDTSARAMLQAKQSEIDRAEARLGRLREAKGQAQVTAQTHGTVLFWDPQMRTGTYVRRDELLGRIAETRTLKIIAFVEEEYVADVAPGSPVRFLPNTGEAVLPGTVTHIELVPAHHLEYLALGSVAGGELPVVPDADGRLRLLESVYRVEIALAASPTGTRLGQSGRAWLTTSRRRSLLADLLRGAHNTLLRESGF